MKTKDWLVSPGLTIFAAAALLAFSPISEYAPLKPYSLVITNASIVDLENGDVVTQRLLAIRSDTIVAIDDTKMVGRYTAEKYVDVQNRYIIPGLWDMHVHFRGGDALIKANRDLLPLFLVYGVTTVREAGGDISTSVLQWRKQIATGELVGPNIFASGPKIDGHKKAWPGSLRVETQEEISKSLDSLQKLTVDYVKLYDASISREAFLNTIKQAEKRGLKVTGHLPVTVKAEDASAAGLDAIEHTIFVFASTSANDSIVQLALRTFQTEKPLNIFSALPIAYATFSPQRASSLFALLAKNNTAIVPTLYIEKVILDLQDTDHSQDSLLQYIAPEIRATYRSNLTPLSKDLYLKCLSLIPQMQAAGVLLLAGSDCGPFNSFIYPGKSLHEELKLLVAAGLTPVQALKTATINSAKFMGVSKFYGVIQPGKCSDLLVLDKNPVSNIEAIDHIHMVVTKGRLYSNGDMDRLLETIRQ